MIRFYCIFFFITIFISCQHKEQENKEIADSINTSLSDKLIIDDTVKVKDIIEKTEQKSTKDIPRTIIKNIDSFHKTGWEGYTYTSVKEIPELDFPGLNKFLLERIIYPQELFYDTTTQRRIYVSFQVTKEGISQVKVVKGLNGYLDSSCVRAVRQYPKLDTWKQMKKSAKARIIIPFQFKGEGESVRYRNNQIDSNYLKFENNLVIIFGFKPVHHFKD